MRRKEPEKGINIWKFSPEFENFVEQQKEESNDFSLSTNMFGSSEFLEHMNPPTCRLWRETFMDIFNVQIIFIYRRLHCRLPSLWNQQHKYFQTEDFRQRVHKYWPGIDGDIRIPSIDEWIENNPQRLQMDKILEDTYDAWKECAHGFQVMSIHDVDTIATQYKTTIWKMYLWSMWV